MKELKFRVWNDAHKEFDYWGFDIKYKGFKSPSTGGTMSLEKAKELSEQYVGKDKNGKDAYVGDMNNQDDVLMWNDELSLFTFHTYRPHGDYWSMSGYPMTLSDHEITGNIHEEKVE